MRHSSASAQTVPLGRATRLAAATRRYRSLAEPRTSALPVRESGPLSLTSRRVRAKPCIARPGKQGRLWGIGANRARESAPLITERRAKRSAAGRSSPAGLSYGRRAKVKCPHCGCEFKNGHDFELEPVTRAKLLRAKQRFVGEGASVIEMPAIGGAVEIRASAVAEWSETYPAVDVPATLKEIRQWVLAHENRRKVNVRAFVNNWLKREQDRG